MLQPLTRLKADTDVCFNTPLSAKRCQIVCNRHETTVIPSFIGHAASDEQASIREYTMNFNVMQPIFLTSLKIFTKSTTNSEGPVRKHRTNTDASQSPGSMIQRTEVQNNCAGNDVGRTDTFWSSWNIGCKFLVVWICQNVKSTFCTVS